MIYSFDVFDTIVGRKVLIPEGVFFIMQERMMASEYFRNTVGIEQIQQFAKLRKKAELIDAQSRIINVTDITGIYNTLAWLMGNVSADTINRIKLLEIDTECKLAFGIRENIEKVHELLQKGEQVVLISDMYLSSQNIRDILSFIDAKISKLPIYVSSEWGCTKRDGGLFVKVKEKEDVSYPEWIHVGDDEIGDVIVPGLLGIKTDRFEPCPKSDIESFLVSEYRKNNNIACFAAGVARALRINRSWSIYESIGGLVGGGIVFSYALWVVEKALGCDIDRLLFIARDGYIIKQVADIIIKERGYSITTQYVYGSRKAWRVTDNTQKTKAINYIKAALNNDKSKSAFVDYQSAGASLDTLLEDDKDINTIPYFVYGFDYNKSLKKISPVIYEQVSRGISMEVFCRAPHGVTLGYEYQGEELVPVLSEWACDWEKSHQNEFVDGLLEFSEETIKTLNDLEISGNWKDYNLLICDYINGMTDKSINDYIGEVVHDSGENYTETKYAPILNESDLRMISQVGEQEFIEKFYKGCNYTLSLKRTGTALIDCDKFMCNYEAREKKRILLYTAGKQGKKYYNILSRIDGIEIVAWTDMNAEKIRREGFEVSDIKDAIEKDRDCILVPMQKSSKYYKDIVSFLRNIGLQDEIIGEDEIFSKLLKSKQEAYE